MPSSFFPPPRERLPGWEDRLFAVIKAAREEPYALGRHDCFRLACRVVEALTGADVWTPWAGSYGSRREALKRIAEFHAGGFTAAASKFFGSEPRPMTFARRGDICEYADDAGEQHLGVVTGVMVALLGPEGLEFVQRDLCAHCWRIG
jgi:hypothetical protein